MKENPSSPSRKAGRPLSFDPEAALDPAMLLFWRHGYEATSLAELTQAMRVTPPSIYVAYGDKKGLFRAALKRYLTLPISPFDVIARAPTGLLAARALVEGAVIAFTGDNTPSGCLLASAAIAVSPQAEDVRNELATIRRDIETALCNKISEDAEIIAFAAGTDSATLAAYVMATIQGLSTLARDGADRNKLEKVAQFSLSLLPSVAA